MDHTTLENGAAVTFHPIGRVENDFPQGTKKDVMTRGESRIVLDPSLEEGLRELQNQARILVVFHFHRSEGFELLQHPRGDESRPPRGVFALRSPRRPNPIGITEVELLDVQGTTLRVRGLDTFDGTPVLDLKPA